MSNNELITKYELVFIVDAGLTSTDKEALTKEVADVIGKNGGKVINSQVWLEKQKFTFDIKKRKEGTYYLLNYEADGAVNAKIQPLFKLNEKILRFSIEKAES